MNTSVSCERNGMTERKWKKRNGKKLKRKTVEHTFEYPNFSGFLRTPPSPATYTFDTHT